MPIISPNVHEDPHLRAIRLQELSAYLRDLENRIKYLERDGRRADEKSREYSRIEAKLQLLAELRSDLHTRRLRLASSSKSIIERVR